MRKSTKGALAGVAAVALLLGGFGTRAAWTANGTMAGGPIQDGHLKLNGSCDGWALVTESVDTLGNTVTTTLRSGLTDLSAVFLLPGQLLTRHCAYTVDLAGEASANVDIDAASLAGLPAPTGGLTLATAFALNGAALTTTAAGAVSGAQVADRDVISADFTAKLAANADQTVWEDVSSTLNALTVTASLA